MSLPFLIILCLAFYLLAGFITYLRKKEKKQLNVTNVVFVVYEIILYTLTTAVLILGLLISFLGLN